MAQCSGLSASGRLQSDSGESRSSHQSHSHHRTRYERRRQESTEFELTGGGGGAAEEADVQTRPAAVSIGLRSHASVSTSHFPESPLLYTTLLLLLLLRLGLE